MYKLLINTLTYIATIFLFSVTLVVSAQQLDLSGRTEEDIRDDADRKPAQIIHFAGIKPGNKVLDLLGGSGYYSELLSRVVGDKGEVVLQIPQAYMAYVEEPLKQRLANDRLKNVTFLLSEADDLKIGKDVFDSVFLVLGYHDMFVKDEGWNFQVDDVMPQVYQALKTGGKLLIVDHNTATGRGIADTKTLHRIEAAFTKSDVVKRGFRLVKETDILTSSNDDHSLNVFDPKVRRKTDRFVMLFEKI